MDRGRGGGGGMVGLLLVQAVSHYRSLVIKPPVTAALIAANTLIHIRPKFLDEFLPTIDQVWFNPYLILKHKDLKRLVLSAFYHVGEPHLVCNMLSLLRTGTQLESLMGSVEFASMVAALLGMSQGITLLLAKGLVLFGCDSPYYSGYSVGFSGVLFAMKAVLNSHLDSRAAVLVNGLFTFPLPIFAWSQLVAQMFVPGVPFLGHLGGVLAGLLYMYVKPGSSARRAYPFRRIIWGLTGVLSWPLRFTSWVFRRLRGGRGTVGERGEDVSSSGVWRCGACTYDNNGGGLSACEMCGAERNDRIDDGSPSGNVEELGQQRGLGDL